MVNLKLQKTRIIKKLEKKEMIGNQEVEDAVEENIVDEGNIVEEENIVAEAVEVVEVDHTKNKPKITKVKRIKPTIIEVIDHTDVDGIIEFMMKEVMVRLKPLMEKKIMMVKLNPIEVGDVVNIEAEVNTEDVANIVVEVNKEVGVNIEVEEEVSIVAEENVVEAEEVVVEVDLIVREVMKESNTILREVIMLTQKMKLALKVDQSH